ncbi:MAG: DUF4192 family protein, partial [Nocardioides sp.]|nr:DUF4192 family protein [Nocardioides sp.]
AFCAEEHEFLARAVADGHVTLGSRAELEATVAPVAEQVAETQAALTSAVPLRAGEIGLVVAAGVRGRPLGPERVASLLLALAVPGLRDQMWGRMRRDDARAQVTFWSDVVRRSPAPLVGDAAAVLAFAAWLVGDGALAWCALDRCFAQDRRNSLGLLVARMLDGAIPPSEWERAVAGVSTREPA